MDYVTIKPRKKKANLPFYINFIIFLLLLTY